MAVGTDCSATDAICVCSSKPVSVPDAGGSLPDEAAGSRDATSLTVNLAFFGVASRLVSGALRTAATGVAGLNAVGGVSRASVAAASV